MNQERINNMTKKVKTFLKEEEGKNIKINNIENKINKMEDYITQSDNNTEQKAAFNNFIRKGEKSDLITKSFSGSNDTASALITPQLSKQIISIVNQKSPMRSLASVESISSRALDVIIEKGDLSSGWTGEDDARDETSTSKLIKKTIPVHEIYAQPKATQSLIDDSEINIEGWLAEKIANNFVKLENAAFINGDGEGKPTGLLSNDEIESLEFDKENDSSIDMFLKLISSLDEAYLQGASFLMNRRTLSSIQSVKDNNGRFIWQQSVTDPLKQTIFGIPVVISSDMPDAGGEKPCIAFGDFKSAYKIVDRSEINLLRDPYTDKPFVRFYSVKRVGGDVVNPEAIKLAKI